jgi:hypothetical protein
MSNSKLYQPPPPPPKRPAAPVDPLVALSKAPTVISGATAEALTDLTDDEGLEEWANGGTRIIPKSQMPPPSQAQPQPQPVAVPTMVAAPLPSFYPMAYSTPPQIREKKTSAAIWVVPLALFVFAGGVVAAAAGWYVYHTSDLASASAATDDTSSNVIVPPVATETAPPAVTLTATTAPTVTATASATATTPMTTTTPRVRASSPSTTVSSNGSLRTFAAGNGKPVYVDGKQVGFGGSKITTVCGRHNVSVGTGHARSTEIPCNGPTITVGTPDGT